MADKEANLLIKIKQVGAEAIDSVSDAIKDLGKAALAVFTAISGLIAVAIKEYAEAERATNALNQSLIQQGIYTKELSQQYQDLASALQKKTLFSDEDIVQSQATLQSYLGQTKISKELIQATLDLAQAKGIDLNTAAQMVGKTISTETNALSRQGIEIDSTASKTDKMAEVVEKLNRKMGGQAEAAAQGFGQLTVLKNVTGELFEALGQNLEPIISVIVERLIALAEEARNNEGLFETLGNVFSFVAAVGIRISEQFKILGNALGALAAAATNLSIDPRKWGESLEKIKIINQAANDERVRIETEAQAQIDAMNDAVYQKKVDRINEEQNRLIQSKENQRAIEEESHLIRMQDLEVRSQEELLNNEMLLMFKENQEAAADLQKLNRQIATAKSAEQIQALHMQKMQMLTQARYDAELRMAIKNGDLMAALNSQRVQNFDRTMQDLSRLQDSKNKEMVAIGKAAALAHIAVDTARAAIGAYAALSPIPIVGPALGAAAAAAIVAYGAEQVGRVNSAHMAEGGIVKSTPGGINAVIGEGGKDEAVIPLEDDGSSILGTTINITVNGGLLGDENSARQLAQALDRQLFKMRISRESLAFDEGVI